MNAYRKALKNYSSSTSIPGLIKGIENIILDFGGIGLVLDRDTNGRIIGLMFKVNIDSVTRIINIPILTQKTRGVLESQGVLKPLLNIRTRDKNSNWNDEHAYRVTLANIKDWLDSQLAIFSTNMFEFQQIFLPYMQGGDGRTFYEIVKESNFVIGMNKSK